MADQRMIEEHRKTWHDFVKVTVCLVAVTGAVLALMAFFLI